ncbi:hypothetical protein V6N13_052663 [Hibiscus sabdariffa]
MGSTALESYGSSMGPRSRGSRSTVAMGLGHRSFGGGRFKFCSWSVFPSVSLFWRFCSQTIDGCRASELVPFFRVALSWSKALMKLALVSRSRPSKALWCLAFVVPTFTALGANDGTLGIVAKIAVRDPSSIQVYGVHLQPLCYVLAFVLFSASMLVLLLIFCLSFLELSMLVLWSFGL